jgi:hypothetical protein
MFPEFGLGPEFCVQKANKKAVVVSAALLNNALVVDYRSQ